LLDPPIAPQAVAGDWEVGTPASQGVTQTAVNKLLDDIGTVINARGAVVARNGKLIGERYYNGYAMANLQHVRSVTKSVSSLMIGRAIASGAISGTSATVAQLLPEAVLVNPTSQLRNLTLDQVLSMRTGVVFSDSTQWGDLITPADSLKYVMSLPAGTPGTFHYDSAGSHLPSPILERIHNMKLDAVVDRDLFKPLGIQSYAWTKDALGVPYGSFGLQLRTRDTAKIAQLVLNNGVWAGQQIVPANWITQSTSLQAQPAYNTYGAMTSIGYGYLWWLGSLGGKQIILGWGYAGQFAVIVRSLNLVIQTNTFHSVDGPLQQQQEVGLLQAVSTFLSVL
jgi:CubicO group peptidase (beta-lactamase class C family)